MFIVFKFKDNHSSSAVEMDRCCQSLGLTKVNDGVFDLGPEGEGEKNLLSLYSLLKITPEFIRSLDEWYLTDGTEKEDLKELYLQEIKRNQIRKYPEAFGRVVKGNARTVPMGSKFKTVKRTDISRAVKRYRSDH